MAQKFFNNYSTTLNTSVLVTDLTIDVATGTGAALLGALTYNDNIMLTLSGTNGVEVVKVTLISVDTLTVSRAQEGTVALAFGIGDIVEVRVTQGTMERLELGSVPVTNITASTASLNFDEHPCVVIEPAASGTTTITIADPPDTARKYKAQYVYAPDSNDDILALSASSDIMFYNGHPPIFSGGSMSGYTYHIDITASYIVGGWKYSATFTMGY